MKSATESESGEAWQRYRPNDSAPWNLRRVVHLHRRAGFAATWKELQRDLRDGAGLAIDRVLDGKARSSGVPKDFTSLADSLGEAAVRSDNPERLKAWWLYRMLHSPDPLTEKLTLTWHDHFATSNLKIDDLVAMRRQNEVFRKHARGSFGDLVRAVVRDPTMLLWLDAESNRKGSPNENLARELLELFTLGIGNYSEDDVKNAARALTGWTVLDGEFHDEGDGHDEGKKTILGQVGRWRGDDLIRITLDHPATAQRLAWRLCRLLMGEGVVTDAALGEFARGLRKHELNIEWGVATLLRSKLFFSEANLGSKIASPPEFALSAVWAFEMSEPSPNTLLLAEWLALMGQDLFYPPNVGGWSGGKDWLSAQYVIARANFATALAQGRLAGSGEAAQFERLCQSHGFEQSPEGFLKLVEQLLLGYTLADDLQQRMCAAANKATADADQRLNLVAGLILALPQAQRL